MILGVGIDIVRVGRLGRIAERSWDLFADRVLGSSERRVMLGDWGLCARHVAAKEAVFKALGTGLRGAMRWSDVEVLYTGRRPYLAVSGATEEQFRRRGVQLAHVSVAGDRRYAVAAVVLSG